MSITLPNEMASGVRERVALGDYASESEVIREGLRALAAKEAAIERWLQTEVVRACAESDAHPELSISADEVANTFTDFFARRRLAQSA
ncbi:MAG: type II toxin-antitoxin system ParD family antitoxin [Cellulomonadaceae bacterium]|nr:type II toxin-antitoxin system ParD family antitoxin [Cellulomonadaceae bacterium]